MSTKMRTFKPESHGNQVETWWYKRKGNNKPKAVKSDNLKPVCLPVGAEMSIVSAIKRLPK